MSKRQCTNPLCYMQNLRVETPIDRCIACDDPMPTDVERFVDSLSLGSIFGGGR